MIRRSRHDAPLHGFTLIELLVVVAIISLLISILLPSLTKAKDLAKSTVCQARQREIGNAVAMYAHDTGFLPKAYCLNASGGFCRTYAFQLRQYVGDNAALFDCPVGDSSPSGSISDNYFEVDYGINNNLFYYYYWYYYETLRQPWGFLADVPGLPPGGLPSAKLRFLHYYDKTNLGGWDSPLADWHMNGCNVLFTDFHVEWGRFEDWQVADTVFGAPGAWFDPTIALEHGEGG